MAAIAACRRDVLRLTAAGVLVLAIGLLGPLEFVDRYLGDLRMSLFTRPPTDRTLLVALDAESLAELDGFPLPRRLYAEAIDRLIEAGAAKIAVDVDFGGRSDPEDDAALAAAVARAGEERIALAALRQIRQIEPGVFEWIERTPPPAIAEGATIAHVNVAPDPDGRLRRARTAIELNDAVVPSLSSWLAGDPRAALDRAIDIDFSIDAHLAPYVGFADLIAGRIDPAAIEGKLVLIGATDLALGDYVTTPRYGILAGVLAHFLAVETLLQDRDLIRLEGPAVALAAALLCILVGLWLRRRAASEAAALAIGLIASIESAAALIQPFSGMMLASATLDFAVLLGLAIAIGDRLERTGAMWLEALAMARSNQLLTAKVVDNAFDAILTFDPAGEIRSANRAAQALFGRPDRLAEFAPEDESALLELAAGTGGEREIRAARADGSSFLAEASVASMTIEDGWIGVLSARDVTDRKAHEAVLREMATHDALTGLPNRAAFADRLDDALARGEPFACLLLDLDRFKEVNDTLGHATGDRLLQVVGPRLRPHLREGDLIARLGGDEFAALLEGPIALEDAEEIAARLVEALIAPFRIDELEFELGASIGVALHPEHGDDRDALIQRADVAMYQAKRGQLGFVVYDPVSDRNSVRRLTLQGELRRAIEEDQLFLYHQPKVSTTTGELKATEALVRWSHPQHGFMPPDEFIPMAERTGLIEPLTDWVVGAALAQRASWAKVGLDIPIAVNLSAKSLSDPGAPSRFAKRVEAAGQEVSGLIMEVTESAVMEDADAAIKVLEAFRGHGFKLSLDDFGTGHSSFAYLQSMPVQELKIDRAFVLALENGRQAAAILRSIVNLAKELELSVVVEGVEDERTFRWLGAIGADLAQGYFLSKPIPGDELAGWPGGFSCADAVERIQRGDRPNEADRASI